ncbi:MAG TPA: hypothetical protein VN222_02580 [Novosphingobium sp.]|nr:hypothetical protein [Novosphingobium sp.]
MRVNLYVLAAMAAVLAPASAMADDPNDPAMRDPVMRARDREMVRQLNLRENERTRARDERFARERDASYSRYADNQAQYERQMAAWRQSVAACRAGDYSACN